MKRLLILLAIGVCIVPPLPAQNKLQPGFSFGLKTGFQLADFSGADVDSAFITKVGFTAGGLLAYRLSDAIAVQAEILYTQKGSRLSTKVSGVLFKEWFRLDYLEIPVLLKFLPPMESRIRPMFFAGPYVAAKVRFKEQWEFGEESATDDIPTFRKTEYGFAAGGGLDFPVGTGTRISAEIRYTRGISTLTNDSSERVRNAIFAILVGIAFGK